MNMESIPAHPASGLSRIEEIYGKDVFGLSTMKRYLSRDVYKNLLNTIKKGSKLDSSIADEVAEAMKQWAISNGATHYTHWFQPLNDATAEKHEAFLEMDGGMASLEFSGKSLIQGEPDASSFPSGGLRATFEARGYTAWDPTSPAFIKRTNGSATLCIPTAFCSYTGQALDKKTPLLRSMKAVTGQAQRILACFGEKPDIVVNSSLGAEQEYFLVDLKLYTQRPDLIMCGRTIFGNVPPKHQQMEDHYFASIKERILEFMSEVDESLWRLGIPAKTRHNEVAPAQFEIAPIFEGINLAVDHNMQLMEVLSKTATKHGFACLFHEKPFDGINGSGKHNNWSLGAPGFGSLLNPGKSPHENAIFLTFLCAVIEAVDKHADLLRASVAKAGNDHRLGANEAPPAIISIYLGDLLDEIINQIEQGQTVASRQSGVMKIGVDSLPEFPLDTSDRNRTSPFAFTGNKFEFRAVGSSQTCAWPMTVLNLIVAEALDRIASILEPVAGKPEFRSTLQETLRDIVKKHKRIIFNGNGYSDEWIKEAERRGLPHLRTTPEALAILELPETVKLFSDYGVMSPSELHARYETQMEIYGKELDIEAKTAAEMVRTLYIPAVSKYLCQLHKTIASMSANHVSAGSECLAGIAASIGKLCDDLPAQLAALEHCDSFESQKSAMATLRFTIDSLEALTDPSVWPVPTYAQLLYIR